MTFGILGFFQKTEERFRFFYLTVVNNKFLFVFWKKVTSMGAELQSQNRVDVDYQKNVGPRRVPVNPCKHLQCRRPKKVQNFIVFLECERTLYFAFEITDLFQ